MAIPFAILRNVRLTRRQKWILYPLFSLVVVTIIVTLVRAVLSTQGLKSKIDIIWMLFFINIEACTGTKAILFRAYALPPMVEKSLTYSTAIIVACVGSLRTLFTQDDQSPRRARRTGVSPPERLFPQGKSEDALQLKSLEHIPPSLEEDRSSPVPYAGTGVPTSGKIHT